MDDTQASMKNTDATTATRKRRSSILKSQRPARTPLSELEFNVATPTDATKSRRVSFSRRTGVAEFVTNEATTTWKNFYEEHNKSLESSGLEAAGNAHRQPFIGHIGKRIFDQQFQEVEVEDIGYAPQPNSLAHNFHTSLNNLNITQQLLSLECPSDDRGLCAPIQNMTLRSLSVQQSKIFGDDLLTNEFSNPISVNLSNMQPIILKDTCDDLDEIVKDLERSQSAKILCPGPFTGEREMSEYIEIDLNLTHIGLRNDDCDLSLTGTIQNPEVQVVTNCESLISNEKKTNERGAWIVDKENIAVNPYVTPKESVYFAVNELSDKILVFDGKKLKVQTERKCALDLEGKNVQNTIIPNHYKDALPEKNSPTLDEYEELPSNNSVVIVNKENNTAKGIQDLKQSIIYNECDLSMTQALDNNIEIPVRKPIVFRNSAGDISLTQPVPAKVIVNKLEKRKTVFYHNDGTHMPLTQTIPTNIRSTDESILKEKRTIVYEDDNISFTQAVPTNLIFNSSKVPSKNVTIFHQQDSDMSFTQLIRDNVTNAADDCYDNNIVSNISMTQVIPSNIITSDPKLGNTVIYNTCDDVDIEITKGVSENVILSVKNGVEKNKTIVYENDTNNISITETIPDNIIFEKRDVTCEKLKNEDISVTQVISSNIISSKEPEGMKLDIRRKNSADLSVSPALPAKLLSLGTQNYINDISIIETIPDNIISEKRDVACETLQNENISVTQVISSNIILSKEPEGTKLDIRRKNSADFSVTPALPAKLLSLGTQNDINDISITKPIPDNIIYEKRDVTCETLKNEDISVIQAISSNKILSKEPEGTKLDIRRKNSADLSVTPALSAKLLSLGTPNDINDDLVKHELALEPINNSLSSKNFNSNENENVINTPHKENSSESPKTKIYDNPQSNLSITKPIPIEVLNTQSNILKDIDIDIEKSVLGPIIESSLLNDTNRVKQNILVYQSMEYDGSQTKLKHQNCMKTSGNIENLENISLKCEDKRNTDSLNLSKLSKYSNNEASGKIINLDMVDRKEIIESEYFSNNTYLNQSPPKAVTIEKNKKTKKILNELLDMSNASLDNVVSSHLNDMAPDVSPTKFVSGNLIENNDSNSSESMFVIIRDSEDNADAKMNQKVAKNCSEKNEVTVNHLPRNDFIEKSEDIRDLQDKVDYLKAVNEEKRTTNRHYETVISNLDPQNNQKNLSNAGSGKTRKSFKKADDTRELLGMLADFTDEVSDEDDKPIASFEVKNDKDTEKYEQKRLSFYPSRQSIALSREDLLHTISMAQAALQQSRFEIDENESIADTRESPDSVIEETGNKSGRKSVRMSNEVVKTLQFHEDDSIADTHSISGIKVSPLKKTAFGETSYMRDRKAKVIPTYLKDVSDNIKALMNDLVKPTAGVMPFDSIGIDKSLKTSPSICSTQIQANLFTSSQIDMDVELHSDTESGINVKTEQSMSEVAALGNKAISDALKHSIKPVSVTASIEIDNSPIIESLKVNRVMPHQSQSGPVIVFDQLNPLNNVLLTPADFVKIHGYDPIECNSVVDKKRENTKDELTNDKNKKNKFDVERLSAQYNFEDKQSTLQSGDTGEAIKDSNSLISNISKPLSIDRSVEVLTTEVKDTEANTVIAMKANKELLQVNSSLTLVDDAIAQSAFDVNIESATSEEPSRRSPLRVIYHMETDGEMVHKIDSDFMSNDAEFECLNDKEEQLRKRSYSSTKRDISNNNYLNLETTPKPVSKMLKISNNPKSLKFSESRCDFLSKPDNSEPIENSDSPKQKIETCLEKVKSSKQNVSRKSNELTVQQISMYRRQSQRDQTMVERKIQEAIQSIPDSTFDLENLSQSLGVSSEDIISCTSSRAEGEDLDADTVKSQPVSSLGSNVSRVNWQPDLVDELSSKNLAAKCISSANVVAKIDTLPFMGRECEWESTSGDVWMFRLLRSRIRLTARLQHTHHNAPRSRVRADTALAALTVDPVHTEERDTLASVCVRLAAEAMRYECARDGGCRVARDVPALLRRCAALARVALRWARAMQQARLRLAYTITPQGDVTLKVANISLRSVWEVRLRVELVVEDAREPAWPRASLARACAVLADSSPAPALDQLIAPLPRDWGHAPATIWKVFKYLKNKTKDDELI